MPILTEGFVLDTSVVVRLMRQEGVVAERLAETRPLLLPQTALGELYSGAFQSANPTKHLRRIAQFLGSAKVIAIDDGTPEIYGRLAAHLARAGTPIPQNDIWIAATALQVCRPLITLDRHFQLVPELQVLLW